MKIKLIISLLFGAFFVWLAVRGVDFGALRESLATMNYIWLVPFLVLTILYQVLRVVRWKLILGKDYPIPFRRLFSINIVGFMAINILPFRLGEVARPYLLLEKEDVPLGPGLASALIERMLDFLCMLLVLALVVFGVDLPTRSFTLRGVEYPIMDVVQKVFVGVALPAVGGLIGLMLFEEWMYKLMHWTIGRLWPRLDARMEAFFRSFMASLKPLRNPRTLLVQVLLTLLIWGITPVTEWIMFKVMNLNHLGFDASLTVVAAILIGMLIPGPPGFAGNFEAFTEAGLAIYGVRGGVALGYALMLHWFQFVVVTIMGFYYIYRDQISFRSIVRFSRELKSDVRRAE